MAKIDRNDPCPCGSGLRFKQCCLSTRRLQVGQFPQGQEPEEPFAEPPVRVAVKPPPPSAQTIAKLAAKTQQFEQWKDEPLKSLGGLTPRQAAGHPRAWRKLEVVLKVKEHVERELPEEQRYDFAKLRAELGLKPKR